MKLLLFLSAAAIFFLILAAIDYLRERQQYSHDGKTNEKID